MGLLRQQGEHPDLGRNLVIKFINRHADLKTKMGRRQEAKRFNSFTPKAVYWYFNIWEGQYSWIKPENTVNVDEGGIMTGFGKRLPLFLWFLEEFKQIADCIEWLERVYLPQITPADNSDARLIILDGHGSHATMATCFLNNVYCCYLPAHCSHGLQLLDNGVFNASKAAYRRELERFSSLTDSTPMDKVNSIRAYAKAHRAGMTKKNILSGWRVTVNWPISRSKGCDTLKSNKIGQMAAQERLPNPGRALTRTIYHRRAVKFEILG
ncbi:hypothetical protein FOXB_15791 [Fusarium oxysporum f. sp. conglutinans Fo5176]|uniref:DDE-1 domain-containing protein n=1 Tax=Fusarium oxysporum (strain Fo5176) TaxID=660025 RepID=F9GAV9_FUSOF|nr:hypothetical protein FOXB_15791 [Fusarium oxysporum f. sp. conglutinans Fo5176]